LELSDNSGPSSEDITFEGPQDYPLGPGKQQNGTTNAVEDPRYQSKNSTVTVIYSEVKKMQNKLIKSRSKIIKSDEKGTGNVDVDKRCADSDVHHVNIW
jgi:hypothetical protein